MYIVLFYQMLVVVWKMMSIIFSLHQCGGFPLLPPPCVSTVFAGTTFLFDPFRGPRITFVSIVVIVVVVIFTSILSFTFNKVFFSGSRLSPQNDMFNHHYQAFSPTTFVLGVCYSSTPEFVDRVCWNHLVIVDVTSTVNAATVFSFDGMCVWGRRRHAEESEHWLRRATHDSYRIYIYIYIL